MNSKMDTNCLRNIFLFYGGIMLFKPKATIEKLLRREAGGTS
jgi:hypothetical protein